MFYYGQEFTSETEVTAREVVVFGQVSGDMNPLHLDSDYASKTIFGRKIVHGALVLSKVSALLGTGIVDTENYYVVYKGQQFDFKAPVCAGDKLLIKARVEFYQDDDLTLSVKVFVGEKEVVSGIATLKVFPHGGNNA